MAHCSACNYRAPPAAMALCWVGDVNVLRGRRRGEGIKIVGRYFHFMISISSVSHLEPPEW